MKTKSKKIKILYDSAKWERVWKAAVAVAAFAGFYFTLFSSVGVNYLNGLAALLGGAVAAVWISFHNKKFAKLGIFGSLALITLILALSAVKTIGGGVTCFINDFIQKINSSTHWGIGYLPEVASSPYSVFAVAAIISCWLGVGIAALTKRPSLLLLAALLAILALVAVGLSPSPFAAVIMIIAALCNFVVFSGAALKVSVSVAAAILVTVSAIGGSFAYTNGKLIGSLRFNVAKSFNKLVYGQDSLPEGKLQNAYSMLDSDDLRLIVTLTDKTPTLYMRGFTGSKLVGTEWQTTDRNAYVENGNQGLIDYISDEGLPFAQYGRYLDLSGRGGEYSVTVKNVGANRRYAYAPYSISDTGGKSGRLDQYLKGAPLKKKAYNFKMAGTDGSFELIDLASWVKSNNQTAEQKSYLTVDEQYRIFVNNTYLYLEEGQSAKIHSLRPDQTLTSTYNVARMMRHWFEDNFDLSHEPDRVENDFFAEFFGGKIKKACPAYYAAAATLIFRAYGYPARYVEGYYVKTDGVAASLTCDVTGQNAHAWTEVYFGARGWLPIEVTPTFFVDDNSDVDPTESSTPAQGNNSENVKPHPEDKPEAPDKNPNDEPVLPDVPLTPHQTRLKTALKVLVPILGAGLVVSLILLVIILRRQIVLAKKMKIMNLNGNDFGRRAIGILDRDCKSLGGYSQEKADRLNVPPEETERFIELVERAVYGGYGYSLSEKESVVRYIRAVGDRVSGSKGKLYTIYCRYIKCIGI